MCAAANLQAATIRRSRTFCCSMSRAKPAGSASRSTFTVSKVQAVSIDRAAAIRSCSKPLLTMRRLRKTNFVVIHGGYPFTKEMGSLMSKPNVYADFSAQTFFTYPRELSETLRNWMEFYPDKILFGTDAFSFGPAVDWGEVAWLSSTSAREALALALTGMMNDGEIDRARAMELARMALHDNAAKLYGLK